MTNSMNILLMVLAVNACVLSVAFVALYRLNKSVDQFDRTGAGHGLSEKVEAVMVERI